MEWKSYFDEYTLYKGFEYYASDMIKNVKRKGNMIDAMISGSEDYFVHVDLNHLENMTCTCPVGRRGEKCKHLAAIFHALENGKIKEDTKEEIVYDFDRMIDEVDEEFLRYFLKILLRNNQDYQKEFLDVIPSIYIHAKKQP